MACALGINVNDGIDEAGGAESRSESDGAQRCLGAGEIEVRSGYAGADGIEILAAANPAGMEGIDEVVANLPIQAAGETIAPYIGGAGSGGALEEGDLAALAESIGRQVAVVHIAAEEFDLLGEVVVETEIHEIVFQGLRDVGSEPSVLKPSPTLGSFG